MRPPTPGRFYYGGARWWRWPGMSGYGKKLGKPSVSGAVAVPAALPVVGHAPALLRDPLRFLSSLPTYGSLPVIHLGPMTAAVACTPELTGRILRDDRTFDKGGPVFERLREGIGDGLGSCPRARHRRQRRLCQPAFHADRMPDYARVMTGRTAAALDGWADGTVIDVHAEMLTLTARVAVDAMFSDALSASQLRQALDDLTEVMGGVYRRAVLPPAVTRLPTPGNRSYHRARARLWAALAAVVTARRSDPVDHGDLLSALLAARDDNAEGASGLTDEEIVSQTVTFFSGGAETTAATLSWALYLVAAHPQVERRLHAEAHAVLEGSEARFEHLPRLQLAKRVITEALRLYPPGWMFTRVATADTELDGHPVPAGTTVAYSPYLIHRRGDLYETPDRFDPDRWAGTPPPRDGFIPFGGGARRCIGDQFGLIHAVLALASITAHCRLEPASSRVRPAVGLVLHPRGLRMRVRVRKDPH
ncbi:cytochrome P450 [Streptomyces sp. NPDC001093]|uniref:cytochrome P450 n=1 Tax=Streptomyces sp. NPDC001093 TaxID=3154376 RepID=UPI00332EB8D4